MIPVYKLERLPAGQRRRKLALLLTSIEKNFFSDSDEMYNNEEYLRGLVRLVMEDPKVDRLVLVQLEQLLATPAGMLDRLRLCNHARHALLAAIGSFPAEWDLIHRDSGGLSQQRQFHPGVSVYAEDIRSPFNLGSIFRTAEAFGAEKILLSPLSVQPSHPRAQRSAMGCIDYLPWEACALDAIPAETPVFALETGGTPLDEFDFPPQGMVIIGSEELGISPEGLARATYGRVSIPMKGIKASLNVGVAFGILMQAWTAYLPCSESKPF